MATNNLYPGFAKVIYTNDTLTHTMTLPLDPTTPVVAGVEPSVSPKVGAAISFGDAIDALVGWLKPIFGAGTSFNAAECWLYPDPDGDPIWVWTHDISEVGTNATANRNMSQLVISYRTALGGIFKNYLMEVSGSWTLDGRFGYPFGSNAVGDLASYLIGDDSWVIGRDNASLVVPIWYTSKINDALRKKRLNL